MSEVVIEVGKRHIREINEELQEACKPGKPLPYWIHGPWRRSLSLRKHKSPKQFPGGI